MPLPLIYSCASDLDTPLRSNPENLKVPNKGKPLDTVLEAMIAEVAYSRWEKAGKPQTDCEAFWEAAVKAIRGDAPRGL